VRLNLIDVKIDSTYGLMYIPRTMTRASRRLPAAAKVGYHHGDLRRALIDAAVSLVADGSVAELSLREVARRAGVTNSAPYHHFADKSALLAAVASQGFGQLVAELERAAARRTTLDSELLAMAEAYVAFAMTHPSHYRVMFLPDLKQSPDADELRAVADRSFGMLQQRVARARTGESERVQQVLATTVWAALHGLSLLAIDGILQNKFPEPEKMLRSACRSIVRMVVGLCL
jgi:AcrR family transcriptional regulator